MEILLIRFMIRFFKPIFKKGTRICIHSNVFNKHSVRTIFEGLMDRPYFPVQLKDKDIRAKITFRKTPSKPFKVGSISIHPIPLSHPKDGGYGFRFVENGKSFVFLTDNELGHVHNGGLAFNEYLELCKGVDLLIHDAEYEDQEYQQILKTSEEPWGHSVLSDVARLAVEADVKQLGLFHLNAMRTDERVDVMVKKAKEILTRKKKKTKCFAVGSSFEIML